MGYILQKVPQSPGDWIFAFFRHIKAGNDEFAILQRFPLPITVRCTHLIRNPSGGDGADHFHMKPGFYKRMG
jgi:hypothetical protein